MTIEKKVAQMFLVGIGKKADIVLVKRMIKKIGIGGVIIYSNNYKNYKEMIELINELKECNKNNEYPLFIAIDQEGGRVNRMPVEFVNIKSAFELGSTNDNKLIEEAGGVTARMLKESGINMDFAPVLDIKNFANNHPIGDRAFSDNVLKVCQDGISYMNSLKNSLVISVIKHFPGHGATKLDSHKILPIIMDYKICGKKHLRPFKEAILNGAEAIMIGHILVKGYTGLYPASLSKKFIISELREKLKYKGVIVTDELSMKSITIIYGKHRAIKQAFVAGNDIISRKYYNGLEQDFYKIVSLVRQGKISMKRIEDSFKRIIDLKEKYKLNDHLVNGCNIAKVNKEIERINNLVLKSSSDS